MKRRDFLVGAALIVATNRVAAAPATDGPRLAIVNISTPTALMREGSPNYYPVFSASFGGSAE